MAAVGKLMPEARAIPAANLVAWAKASRRSTRFSFSLLAERKTAEDDDEDDVETDVCNAVGAKALEGFASAATRRQTIEEEANIVLGSRGIVVGASSRS